MLAVSDDFNSQESGDVSRPVSKVYLILGNYGTAAFGSSASASSSDASGDYPASGAIDGDRTELNVGPASGADNDTGQGSWRSSVAPSVTPQTLIVSLGQSRAINRIKLYHLASHAMSSYKLEYSTDGVGYTLIDKTTDQGGSIATTHEVDTIDFTEITCTHVKLTVSDTVVAADKANVVELEIYRLLDVTDRVLSVKTNRSRDYQLSNALPATANVVLSNTDRFFSPSYSPTSDEVADGFVNSELKPGLGVLVKFGFDYTGSQEYVHQFVGSIDKITIRPSARTATIECRDSMKEAFNRIVSSKLKTSSDIGTIVQYMLNKANISSWESDVDQTGITIDYFFSFDEAIIETIRALVEGSGDSAFFFDENGIATFRSYLNSAALSHTDTDEADFEAGTLTDIDTTTDPGKFSMKWFKLDDWSDGDFTSNPTWTPTLQVASDSWTITSGAAEAVYSTFGGARILSASFGQSSGTWEYKVRATNGALSTPVARFIIASGTPTFVGNDAFITNGYVFRMQQGEVSMDRYVGTSNVRLATAACAYDANYHTIRITRTSAGVFSLYFDGVFKFSVTDSTYTSFSLVGLAAIFGGSTGSPAVQFDDIYWSPVIEITDAVATQGIFVSATIDQGTGISEESIFQTTQIVPTGTTLTWYTATSADGVSWDPYVVAIPDQQIASTVRRYIRYKAVLDSTLYLQSPTITDVTINWNIGTGSTKFPVNVSFVFDDGLRIEMDQVYADTVAGGSSIVNSVGVKAEPLVLDGTNADVQWQGTTGTPPVDISVTNPLGVTNAQVLTYRIVVNGGMDTSRMSGANPAAAAITFAGGGAGSWVFSSIHPTRPVLVITITGTGTITNLQVQGKAFTSNDTFLEAIASDTASIQEFGERRSQISNSYIVNSALAQQIADRLIDNLAEPTTYTPQVKIRPTYSIQIGDRVTLTDSNLGISEDNIVIGVEQVISANLTGGDVYTTLKLLKIAA